MGVLDADSHYLNNTYRKQLTNNNNFLQNKFAGVEKLAYLCGKVGNINTIHPK